MKLRFRGTLNKVTKFDYLTFVFSISVKQRQHKKTNDNVGSTLKNVIFVKKNVIVVSYMSS